MSCIKRNPVFGASDQVHCKSGFTVTCSWSAPLFSHTQKNGVLWCGSYISNCIKFLDNTLKAICSLDDQDINVSIIEEAAAIQTDCTMEQLRTQGQPTTSRLPWWCFMFLHFILLLRLNFSPRWPRYKCFHHRGSSSNTDRLYHGTVAFSRSVDQHGVGCRGDAGWPTGRTGQRDCHDPQEHWKYGELASYSFL